MVNVYVKLSAFGLCLHKFQELRILEQLKQTNFFLLARKSFFELIISNNRFLPGRKTYKIFCIVVNGNRLKKSRIKSLFFNLFFRR